MIKDREYKTRKVILVYSARQFITTQNTLLLLTQRNLYIMDKHTYNYKKYLNQGPK